MDTAKNKIAIISHSLGRGGAERFAGHLSFMLTKLGFEIHNIILTEIQDYEYSGALLNLGIVGEGKPKWKRKFIKGFTLKKYLKDHQITTIIDNRPRNFQLSEWVTRQIYGNRKIYYLIHNYNLQNYLPDSKFLAKLLYGKSEKIICVSQAIENKVKSKYEFKNTLTIYNPADIPLATSEATIDLPEKYILYFGRFDEKAKNFSLMLEAFSKSKVYEKGYQLLLMGEGQDEGFIKTEIDNRNLNDFVSILPFQKDPFAIVSKAKFTLLTSRFEGFPMSIVEALGNGTPVIAVDCNSGPREIIQNEINGLLVENDNPDALANAMNRLIDDEILYAECKKNARGSIAHLSPEAISKKWAEILNRSI